jgi:integrase
VRDGFRRSPRIRRRYLGFGGARSRQESVEVADAALRWLGSYVATTRNAKGQRLARTRLERYVFTFMGGLPLRDLNGDHIRQYRLYLERNFGLRPHTVMHVLSDLRCLLRWAVSSGLIERSPFPPRVMPRIVEVAPRGFDDLDLEVLGRVPGRLGFVLRVLLGTGLRWAEACRATRADVRDGFLEVGNTKSGRVRRVPLSPELLEAIAAGEDRIVPYSATSPGTFSRMVREWTGVDGFHVHRCRHTFAMRWLEAGGNLAVLQHILGHRDLSTTMRYARVTDELAKREAHRVAERHRRVVEDDDLDILA